MQRVELLSVRTACAVVGTLVMLVGVGIGHAQDAGSVTWEQLAGQSEPVSALYAPPSGVLLARAGDDVLWSDDGGDSWRRIPLPSAPLADLRNKEDRYFAIDATNHGIWYANGAADLSKTTDGGACWAVVRPRDQSRQIEGRAYDPATPDRIYLATNEILAPQSFTTAIRVSDDAGVSSTDVGTVGGAGRAIHGLVLGADGANLFAATDAGIWRLRLH